MPRPRSRPPLAERLRPARIALSFLTTLPFPAPRDWRDDDLRRAVPAYPLAGLAIGLPLLLAWLALDGAPGLRAGVAVALGAALTGGLHFDGWCDLADAALAPKAPGERWRIAKDPRVGAFALLAGSSLLLVRFGVLLDGPPAVALLLAPVLARGLVPWTMAAWPPAESSLLGRDAALPAAEAVPAVVLALGPTLPLAALGGLGPLAPALALAALLAWQAVLARFLARRMGGLNGDAYGALIESGEVVVLAALLLA